MRGHEGARRSDTGRGRKASPDVGTASLRRVSRHCDEWWWVFREGVRAAVMGAEEAVQGGWKRTECLTSGPSSITDAESAWDRLSKVHCQVAGRQLIHHVFLRPSPRRVFPLSSSDMSALAAPPPPPHVSADPTMAIVPLRLPMPVRRSVDHTEAVRINNQIDEELRVSPDAPCRYLRLIA